MRTLSFLALLAGCGGAGTPADTADAECATDADCFTVYVDCAQCEARAMSAEEKEAFEPPPCDTYAGPVCDVDPAWRDACVSGRCEMVRDP